MCTSLIVCLVVSATWSSQPLCRSFSFFFNDTAPTEIYTLSLHDALPILEAPAGWRSNGSRPGSICRLCPDCRSSRRRSEEHTSELQSHHDLVCRLLLEKKKKYKHFCIPITTSYISPPRPTFHKLR